MRVHWCDECGDAFDREQPQCRQINCEARVCRGCRDDRGACRSCCREQAAIARQTIREMMAIGEPLCIRTGGEAASCPCVEIDEVTDAPTP